MVGPGSLLIVRNIDPAVGADVVCFDAVGGMATAPASNGQQDGRGQSRTVQRAVETRVREPLCLAVKHGPEGPQENRSALFTRLHQLVVAHAVCEVLWT